MYKILNKLFGWDYVIGHFGYWGDSRIVRLRKVKDTVFCYCDDNSIVITKENIKNIVWLTCNPNKYLKL